MYSINEEILNAILARLQEELPESFLISKNYNEVVQAGENADAIWCHIDISEVKQVQINNTSYEIETKVFLEGFTSRSVSTAINLDRVKETNIQMILDALIDWKYSFTPQDANLGNIDIQGVNLSEISSKQWDTIPGLYSGYQINFIVKHRTYRSNQLPVSGASLWLDASDSSTIEETSGKVSRWKDKSFEGNDAFQTELNNQPIFETNVINGLSSIKFGNPTYSIYMTLVKGLYLNKFDLFVVAKSTDPLPNYGGLITNSSEGGNDKGFNISVISQDVPSPPDKGIESRIGDGNGNFVSVDTFSDIVSTDELFLVNLSYNSQSPIIRLAKNGLPLKTNAEKNESIIYDTANATYIGRFRSDVLQYSRCWNGYISEIIAYNRYLTDEERVSVINYLKNKWGIS